MNNIIVVVPKPEEPIKLTRYLLQHAVIKGQTLDAGPYHVGIDVEAASVSDGHHTMDELYEHRNLLFVGLLFGLQWCNRFNGEAVIKIWKSKQHDDGSMYAGWFIAGAYIPGSNTETHISYHLPLELWDVLKCDEREKAPIFTGYTSKDVLDRIRKYYL